jgi:predicted lipoprotein with Yx(FWY)xxD motif
MKQIISLSTASLVAFALAACGSGGYGDSGSSGSSSSSQGGATISTAKNDKLGQTVLVDSGGMTLYALSAEKGGKFVCTDSKCLAAWHPVVSDGGGKPGGDVDSLATVKRPDGKQQVTYKDQPLYTFASDSKGDAQGEGIKDVGVWHAVTVSGGSGSSGGGGGGSSGGGGGGGY